VKPEKTEKPVKPEKPVKTEKPEKPVKPEKTEKPVKPELTRGTTRPVGTHLEASGMNTLGYLGTGVFHHVALTQNAMR